MSLVECPECARTVSDKAHACINCGFPVAEYLINEEKERAAAEQAKRAAAEDEEEAKRRNEKILAEWREQALRKKRMEQGISHDNSRQTSSSLRAEDVKRFHSTSNQVCCPSCNSTEISAGNKGFGLGKAAAGGLLLGPVGLLGGLVGSKETVITCLRCGFKWSP